MTLKAPSADRAREVAAAALKTTKESLEAELY